MQKDRNCEICERIYLKIVSSGLSIWKYYYALTKLLNVLNVLTWKRIPNGIKFAKCHLRYILACIVHLEGNKLKLTLIHR